MNLKQLLFARSVAEMHSFSKAAQACYASQPTLSNAISQLEDQLGGKLFVRTTRKVGLTSFGEIMLPKIRSVLEDIDELESTAVAFHNPQQKLLRIGLSPLIDMSLLQQVLLPYRQANPDITIIFKECLLDDMTERLLQDQIDFVVAPVGMMKTHRESVLFYNDPLYYIPVDAAAENKPHFQYKLASLPDVPIILTSGGCGLNGSLEALFKNEKATFTRYPGQALSYTVIEEWASLGIGAGILPGTKLSSDQVKAYPVILKNGEQACFKYEWVAGNETQHKQAMLKFSDYISEIIPSLIKGTDKFLTTAR